MTPLSRFRSALNSDSTEDLLRKLQDADQFGKRRVGASSLPDAIILHEVADPNVNDPGDIYPYIRIQLSDDTFIGLHRGPDYLGNPSWIGPRSTSQLTLASGQWQLSLPEGKSATSINDPTYPWLVDTWTPESDGGPVPVDWLLSDTPVVSHVGQQLHTVLNGKWWRGNADLEWDDLGIPGSLLLTDSYEQVWQVGVNIDGTLFTTPVSSVPDNQLRTGLVDHWPLNEDTGAYQTFQMTGPGITTDRMSYFVQLTSGDNFSTCQNHLSWTIAYNYMGFWELFDSSVYAVVVRSEASSGPPWLATWPDYAITYVPATSGTTRAGVFAGVDLYELNYALPGPPVVGTGQSFWPLDIASGLTNLMGHPGLAAVLSGNTGVFSVHFWYQNQDAYDDAVLFELLNSASNMGFRVVSGWGQQFSLDIVSNVEEPLATTALSDNGPISVGVTVDYDLQTASIYINGSLAISAAIDASEPGTVGDWFVSVFSSSSPLNTFVSGLIDAVSLWSRALTTEEHALLFNGGSGLTFAEFQ